jgi:hypothetical protein
MTNPEHKQPLPPEVPEVGVIEETVSKLDYPEEFESRAEEILLDFLNSEGLENCRVVEVRKTRKSIFGSVEIDGVKRFFKMSDPERMLLELQGYKLAAQYPHEHIHHHGVIKDHGIYVQDFSMEMEEHGGLLQNAINQRLDQDGGDLLPDTERLFESMGTLYAESLTPTTLRIRGQNDAFYMDRAKDGGRVDQLYNGKTISLPSIEYESSFEDFAINKIRINGQDCPYTLAQSLDRARREFTTEDDRYFTVSPGDPTEANLTVNGKYFDFEVGGYNCIVQDVAIFASYNYFGGHYIIPKYSKADGESGVINDIHETENIRAFAEHVTVNGSMDMEQGGLSIDVSFDFPAIKKKILDQYTNLVVKRMERFIPVEIQARQAEKMKKAVVMRLLGVKNILRFEEKDFLLCVALTAYFDDDKEYASMSEYIESKFKGLNHE